MNWVIAEMSKRLLQGQSFVLATIMSGDGSAPRTAGAQMIVNADGSIVGTIGGGLLEAQVLRIAKNVFNSHSVEMREFEFSGKDAAQMDMICGGRQTVLVDYMDAGDAGLQQVCSEALALLQQRQKAWWITIIQAGSSQHALVKSDGVWVGAMGFPVQLEEQRVLLNFQADQPIDLTAIRNPLVVTSRDQKYFLDPVDVSGTVYIFGAGHVAQKLALLSSLVGFYTIVLDDRPDFANCERFPSADEILVLERFENSILGLNFNPDCYVVIVTRGHLKDQIVLEQVLKTRAGYIGMIGSRRKREMIYTELVKQGFNREELNHVYSPIGLQIGADSPEEIAISIAAELIQVRAQVYKNRI